MLFRSRRLGCPAATLTTRLFRARHSLRRRLSALGLAVPVALTAESVVDVPAALASAALEMAAGGSISPAAVRLADGVFRSLYMTKIRWAAVAAAVCLAGVGVFGFQAGGQDPVAGPVAPPTAPAAVAPPPAVPNVDEPATVKTANFRVTAPSQRIGRLIADAAERARRDAAIAWLGKEQPPRDQTCPISVTIGTGTGGATTFNFDGGKVTATMNVEGPLDQLLTDVIPHEVTHVVMADHFKSALPRWSDEGIALLSESDEQHARYVHLAAQAANDGNLIQVKALCAAREYPKNIAEFFAESYLLAETLVDRRDRATFLQFVRDGMKDGWESAAKTHYETGLDDLERDMLTRLKAEHKTGVPAVVDRANKSLPAFALATADDSGQVTVFERTIPYYEPVTSYVRREVRVEGQKATRSYMEPVTNYRLRTTPVAPRVFDRGTVRALTPTGKPIEEAALMAALKGKTVAVVLVQEAGGLDKAFANLLKSDTLVLVVPATKAELPPPAVSPGR